MSFWRPRSFPSLCIEDLSPFIHFLLKENTYNSSINHVLSFKNSLFLKSVGEVGSVKEMKQMSSQLLSVCSLTWGSYSLHTQFFQYHLLKRLCFIQLLLYEHHEKHRQSVGLITEYLFFSTGLCACFMSWVSMLFQLLQLHTVFLSQVL